MEETGTLGVRILDIPRLVAHRSRQVMRVTVGGKTFDISVKTSTVNGTLLAKKPEYEDLKKIAQQRTYRSKWSETKLLTVGYEIRRGIA